MTNDKHKAIETPKGIWRNLFPKHEGSRMAKADEVQKTVKEVIKKQADVLRLLERE